MIATLATFAEQRASRASFELFTHEHILISTAFVAWIAGVLLFAHRLKRKRKEPAFRRLLAIAGTLFVIAYNVFWLCPMNFDAAASLPIHICDVAILFSGVALWTNWRLFWSLTYFLGIALSTQAFATPTELAGPGSPYFWAFWIAHTQIVGVALYLPVILDYRPTWVDLVEVLALGITYTGAMFILNASYGWDYAFVGPNEDPPGVVALLGEWPLRALWVVLLASLACTLAWLPWAIARRLGGSPPEPDSKAP